MTAPSDLERTALLNKIRAEPFFRAAVSIVPDDIAKQLERWMHPGESLKDTLLRLVHEDGRKSDWREPALCLASAVSHTFSSGGSSLGLIREEENNARLNELRGKTLLASGSFEARFNEKEYAEDGRQRAEGDIKVTIELPKGTTISKEFYINDYIRSLLDTKATEAEEKRFKDSIRLLVRGRIAFYKHRFGDIIVCFERPPNDRIPALASADIFDACDRPPRLEAINESALHDFTSCAEHEKLISPTSGHIGGILSIESSWQAELSSAKVILLQHDWREVLINSPDFASGEIHQPFPTIYFEARINGLRMIFFLMDFNGNGGGRSAVISCKTSAGWAVLCDYDITANETLRPKVREHYSIIHSFAPIAQYFYEQVKAACIVLEAEVAAIEVKRAPHKLNQSRVKAGKLPANDYHVINLSRRRRIAPSDTPAGVERNPPRLHFVRGHWRHYANSKTWVKWHLRGDADLGFIDKHYRL